MKEKGLQELTKKTKKVVLTNFNKVRQIAENLIAIYDTHSEPRKSISCTRNEDNDEEWKNTRNKPTTTTTSRDLKQLRTRKKRNNFLYKFTVLNCHT